MSLRHQPSPTLLSILALVLAVGCAAAPPKSEPVASEATIVPEVPIETGAAPVAEATTEPATEAAPQTAASTTEAPAAVFSEDGVAIRGADAVAYFTQGEYVPGNADYTYDWGGATWQFSSAEHRDLFANNPGEYAPQYGGFCAWAVSEGYTAPVDPTAWEIVDGKLYLNFDQRIQRRWQQDIPGHIARADQNWPSVVDN